MNKEYAIKDEKTIIVSDENGTLKEKENTSNKDEILIQENVIELVEKKLEEVSGEKEKTLKFKKIYKKLMKIFLAVMGISGGLFLALYNGFLGIFPTMQLYTATLDIIVLILGFLFESSSCIGYSTTKKTVEETDFQSYFLEKDLERENKKLQELYKNSEYNQHKEENSIVQINDRERLQKLRIYLENLQQLSEEIPRYAYSYARGKWEKEEIEKSGLDTDLFENYLIEYNTDKLTRNKKVS